MSRRSKLLRIRSLAGAAVVVSTAALPAAAQTRDEQVGAEMAELVEEQIGIYQGPLISDYVDAIGTRLVDHLDDDRFTYEFSVADQFEPNAFALPGGWVYLSRGLLVLANDEDELAGVIGHEISHITERHSAKRQRKGVLGGVLQIPGAVVGAVVNEDLGKMLNAPIATISQVPLAAYSRGQESEADRLGMRLAARTGYDPAAIAEILAHLEADVEMLTGETHRASFFDSHPTTPDRVEDINREAARIQWTRQIPIAAEKRDFLSHLDGLWYDVNPAQGVFSGQHFYQPDLGFTITFPAGWKTINTPGYVGAYADSEKAIVLISIAGDEDPSHYAARFEERLETEHQTRPLESQAVTGEWWTGYHVSVLEDEQRGGERSYLHYLWARLDGVTYQLVAAGADRYRESLRTTAYSMRPLTEGDWESITALRVRVVEARAGERLPELGERTDNRWTPEYTALINNVDAAQALEAGTLVKIARREPYRPN